MRESVKNKKLRISKIIKILKKEYPDSKEFVTKGLSIKLMDRRSFYDHEKDKSEPSNIILVDIGSEGDAFDVFILILVIFVAQNGPDLLVAPPAGEGTENQKLPYKNSVEGRNRLRIFSPTQSSHFLSVFFLRISIG